MAIEVIIQRTFKDNAQADEILDGPLGAEILKSLEGSKFKGLCFSENGFRNLTNNKRAVHSQNGCCFSATSSLRR